MNIDESYKTYYKGPVSDHFDGELFFNPWAKRPDKGFWDIIKWRMNGQHAKWPDHVDNPPKPPVSEHSQSLKVTFIGHATTLIQIRGINLLADPVFSERCSPFSAIGPKRVRAPFVPLEKLPKIDFVFVSHNHYDHLDLASLSWLAHNHKPVFYTPLGNTRIFAPVIEKCTMLALDWHQSADLGKDLTLTLTPSQHWSRRSFGDTCRDLWGGFVLKEKNGPSLYFAGDTGFDKSMFDDIHRRYEAPDIALLPIGAYEPRWFMKYSHMSPDDAMEALKILKAKKTMAVHFETFQLTDESIDAPRKRMEELIKENNIQGRDFIVPYPGDTIAI